MTLSRRRWLAATGLSALAATPTALLAQPARAPLPLPAIGSVLPLAPAPLLLGAGRFEPAEAQGHAVVLYWWASWCPFCAQQSPEMHKLWLATRGKGLRMLALSIDKQAADAEAYLRKTGYSFPAAWLSPELARHYPKPDGLPVTVVRGKDARVVQAEKGQLFAEDVAELARWA